MINIGAVHWGVRSMRGCRSLLVPDTKKALIRGEKKRKKKDIFQGVYGWEAKNVKQVEKE